MDFWLISRTIVKITGLTLVVIFCALVLGVIALVLMSPRTWNTATYIFVGEDFRASRFMEDPEEDLSNYKRDSPMAIGGDQNSISEWISQCVSTSISLKTPADQQPHVITPPSDTGTIENMAEPDTGVIVSPEPGSSRSLFGSERILVGLSKNLAFRRVSWNAEAERNYIYWQIATFVTIGIGMLTTVFVSLSSTDVGRGDGKRQTVVRTMAIVLPAIGTAAAAIIGFYGFQTNWSQATRSLASLSQLHSQMAIDIWKLKCPRALDDNQEKALLTALDGWSKRYSDIEALSNAAGASAGSTPGGEKQQAPAQGAGTNAAATPPAPGGNAAQ